MVRKKFRLIILLCAITHVMYAQKDSVNTITLKFDKSNTVHVEMPKETGTGIKDIIPYFPGVAIIVTLIGLWIETIARRNDDNKKNQLERINKQISEFYMPLHTLYEKGDKNYYSFISLFGTPADFRNPNFKDWAYSVFQHTNTGMRNIIIEKADLVIGNKIPAYLFQFSNWADAFKLYLDAYLKKDFDQENWDKVFATIKHPEIIMQAYLSVSVEILKKEQNLLLTGKIKSIDESKLNDLINEAIPKCINDIEKENERTWQGINERQSQQRLPAKPVASNKYLHYIFPAVLIVLIKFLKSRKMK